MSTHVLEAILKGINAFEYLPKFVDAYHNDNSLETFSNLNPAQIVGFAKRFGFPDDLVLAKSFVEGCGNPQLFTSPGPLAHVSQPRIEVIACTCNRPLYLAKKFPANEFDSLFKEESDIVTAIAHAEKSKDEARSSDAAAKLEQIKDRIHQKWAASVTQALSDVFGCVPTTFWPNQGSFVDALRDSKDLLVHLQSEAHAAALLEGRLSICRYIAAKFAVQGLQLKTPFRWKCTCGLAGRMFSDVLCEYKSRTMLQLKVSRCNLRVGMQLFLSSQLSRLSCGTYVQVMEASTSQHENLRFLGEITTINGDVKILEVPFQENCVEVAVSLFSPLHTKIPYAFCHDGKCVHADLVEMTPDELHQRLKAEFSSLHLQEMHAFRDNCDNLSQVEFDTSLFDQRALHNGRSLFISSTVRDRVKERWSQFVQFMSFESICDICMRCSSSDMESRSNGFGVSEINGLFRYMNPLPPEALISAKCVDQEKNIGWKENIRQWCQAGATAWPSEIFEIFMFSLHADEKGLSSSAKNVFFYVLLWACRIPHNSDSYKQSNMSQLLLRLPQVEFFLPFFTGCIQILHRQLIFEWLLRFSSSDAISILRSFDRKKKSGEKREVRCKFMGGKDENSTLSHFVATSAPWTLSLETRLEKEMESFLEYDGDHHFFSNPSPNTTPTSLSQFDSTQNDANCSAHLPDVSFLAGSTDVESKLSSESFVCLYFSSYEILRLRAHLNASFSQRIRVSHLNSTFVRVAPGQFEPGASVKVAFNKIGGSTRSNDSKGLCFLDVCRIVTAESNIQYDTNQNVPRLVFGDVQARGRNQTAVEYKPFDEIELVATALLVDVSAGILLMPFPLFCLSFHLCEGVDGSIQFHSFGRMSVQKPSDTTLGKLFRDPKWADAIQHYIMCCQLSSPRVHPLEDSGVDCSTLFFVFNV
jgi:hypothetical protein